MCRLLVIRSKHDVDIAPFLRDFSRISKNSKEYQGHGWGISYLGNNKWQEYRNIKPIWEDDLGAFGKTTLLIAHARSAYQDKDIIVENNMPFFDAKYHFIFNGELRGVKIREKGRIGAEKIFNYIKRFDHSSMKTALKLAVESIKKKTRHIKAMNIMLCDKSNIYLSTDFNEDENYFTMHYREGDTLIVCSEPLGEGFNPIPNHSQRVF